VDTKTITASCQYDRELSQCIYDDFSANENLRNFGIRYNLISLSGLITPDGNFLPFSYPIQLRIEADENGLYYINEDFGIFAGGVNQEEAKNDIYTSLMDSYGTFVNAPCDELDDNAKKIKENLVGLLDLGVNHHAKKS